MPTRLDLFVPPNKWYKRAWGVILGDGNSFEFPVIEKKLKEREIDYVTIRLPNNGRIFAIPEDDCLKLPTDLEGPFLPAAGEGESENGHSIYPITVFQIAAQMIRR